MKTLVAYFKANETVLNIESIELLVDKVMNNNLSELFVRKSKITIYMYFELF